MRVLVACEFSGVVRDAFRARGHDAVSCDLLPSERPGPGPHIVGDVRDIFADGWDLMIAHPPCTFLANSGAKHLYLGCRRENGAAGDRWANLGHAAAFFIDMLRAPTRKGEWRHYDWRDVVCLAVTAELRRIPIDTATALRCAGDELRRGTAGYDALPPARMHWLVREVGHERRMSFEPADAVAASLAEARTTLAVDVARVGWAALNRLEATSGGTGMNQSRS